MSAVGEAAESEARLTPTTLDNWRWEDRLLKLDEDALRTRLAMKKLRPRQQQVNLLAQRVLQAFDVESEAIDALEAEAQRQHQQQQAALKYGYA